MRAMGSLSAGLATTVKCYIPCVQQAFRNHVHSSTQRVTQLHSRRSEYHEYMRLLAPASEASPSDHPTARIWTLDQNDLWDEDSSSDEHTELRSV